ncbi:hypothetical protein PF005_g17729 [Phytophthora fragariae]|uniref:Secreted protein n=1 Tax=Phytophthora fragariae TaxID=53985 RepID=A0A6A3H7V3_9STRA|nr:hypothetical protein PF003_g24650 [Phytophthora fragariae]KAE8926815.1 hypothetical protein PF009_g23000 [Phytophthora fragariae]KAE8965370.1 hypothetical protein PF011_g28319 [Phytophthora fragariae]KAE9088931.1 hypothetical protein PF010_g19197 [Phytophthora fragariae]KAE9094064.1 hypothetical protein PF007_g17898 [Phytophthora fragariae]
MCTVVVAGGFCCCCGGFGAAAVACFNFNTPPAAMQTCAWGGSAEAPEACAVLLLTVASWVGATELEHIHV